MRTTGEATTSSIPNGHPAAQRQYFDAALLADPELAGFFPGSVSDRHRQHVVRILGQALGEPERYHGPDLVRIHEDLGISDANFDAVAAHLATVLSDLSVPADLAGQVVEAVASLRPAVVSAAGS